MLLCRSDREASPDLRQKVARKRDKKTGSGSESETEKVGLHFSFHSLIPYLS